MLFAVAGGMMTKTARKAIQLGADIIIVGRYITQSKNIERSIAEFLECAHK